MAVAQFSRSNFVLCFLSHFYLPASGQAMVTGVVPSAPRFLPSIFIAHRVQQSPCSSIFLSSVANSSSRAFRKSIYAQEKVPTILYVCHSGGLELTKLTFTRVEDNLIRHRGDRLLRTYKVRFPAPQFDAKLSSSHQRRVMLAAGPRKSSHEKRMWSSCAVREAHQVPVVRDEHRLSIAEIRPESSSTRCMTACRRGYPFRAPPTGVCHTRGRQTTSREARQRQPDVGVKTAKKNLE